MSRVGCFLFAFLVACGGGDAGPADEGSTGGETATSPVTSTRSCGDMDCAAGTHCEVIQVQCIRAPCPPIPQCIDDTTTCASMLCPTGTHCQQGDGIARCVGDSGGVPCGATTCAAGQVCCNASCGICTPPDGVCIQRVCD